jgi:hypothetical protein
MNRSLLFVLFLVFSFRAHAQEFFRVPAAFRALGDASVSLQSPLSVYSNPAGFAGVEKAAFGLQYENRFLLDDLRTTSAFLVFPFKNMAFGLSLSQFGKGGFREDKFSFGVAKSLSKRLSAAVQFHYFSLYLPENRQGTGTLAADIGAQYLLGNGFALGAQVFNPYEIQIQTLYLDFNYPAVLRLGMHKVFDETLLFAIEARKQTDRDIELNSGMELRIRDKVQLRLGIEARAAIFSLGLGYSLERFQTDLAFSYHQYLGYSPAFSIYYQLP